ncbi:hypothetical protein [Nocardia sp. NPDC056100]|uniref:hypothetical protein n=1 Tax=Nocardia sp. NPDC056100 TaxID=3345712 RepID=UPI0035E10E42
MPEEFDEALEAARAEWASEHDAPYYDHPGTVAAAMPGYKCIDLSQLSSHDLRLVDDLLTRYRSQRRPSRFRPLL